MKILLINPPVFNDIGVCKSQTPCLSLLYLAGFLEKNGYPDVKVIDADLLGLTWQNLGDLFVKENPDIIGITAPSFILPALVKTAKVAQERLPNCKVIVGGFGPTHEPEKVLKFSNQAIDFVVMGEGEITLFELVKRIENQAENFNDINGLAFFNQGGSLMITEPRGYIEDLDSLPWPAYHLLEPDFSKYPGMPAHYKEMKRPVATMFASRGCPYRCTFCSLSCKMYRCRNPKDIVAEAEFYKNKFGVGSIQIYDDAFVGMNRKQNEWVEEICNEIIRKGLHKSLTFLVQGRCSRFIELETLKKMREAGFVWIWWGVESGSPKVLESIKKDLEKKNIFRAFGLAKQVGFKCLMFIMVGFPGETPADIKLTANVIKGVKPDQVRIHVLTPQPGSEARKYLKEHNLLDNQLENLSDYYRLDTNRCGNHHTKEMTSTEIESYRKFLIFRFEHSYWHFIKFVLKSLTTLEGWKKLFKRIKIMAQFFLSWWKAK